MQKTFFSFNRDKAKLVPIDNVAGNAGGTTIVIKSNARTSIRCQASYRTSVGDIFRLRGTPYLEPHKICEGCNKADSRNPSHNGYISECIFIEFES